MTITNNIDIIDKKTVINTKYTIKDFPVYMGCTDDTNYQDDIKLDLTFGISPSTGIIQITKYPKNDYILGSHNNAVGKLWNELFNKLINRIIIYNSNSKIIYEIGGGNGNLYKIAIDNLIIDKYIIYEPNTSLQSHDKLEVINKYFTQDDIFIDADIIIHSHVLEHINDPSTFLKNIANNMNDNTIHIFALPNLHEQFKLKYTNVLMFEHKNFLTDVFVEYLLELNNMEILNKELFYEHSIIYVVKKRINHTPQLINNIPNMFDEYNNLLDEFFTHHYNNIDRLNNIVSTLTPIYIFGAHIFTQFLVSLGLDTTHIICILDNDKDKEDKRLYGTTLYVKNPNILADVNDYCYVILNVASYKKEITEQLLKINNKIIIIE